MGVGKAHDLLLYLPIPRRRAEGAFNAKETVVFGDAVAAAGGAGFDKTGVGGDGEIGEGGIFGIAGAVRGNEAVVMVLRSADDVEDLGERTDLIGLDENGVGGGFSDSFQQTFFVGDEQIVANQHNEVADSGGQFAPAVKIPLI